MTNTENDLRLFTEGVCPDCGEKFKTKMPFTNSEGIQPVVCQKCDLYFERVGDMVCRNGNAKAIMDEHWDLMRKGYLYDDELDY